MIHMNRNYIQNTPIVAFFTHPILFYSEPLLKITGLNNLL
jgi:hypothetical protein